MKLSVHLVTWNGAKYIPYLFESLRQQTLNDWELFILDNSSSDGTVAAIEKEIINFPRPVKFIKNNRNSGFAGGHNQLYRQTTAEYFLLLNQDMYLQANCLEKMVSYLLAHPDVAAVAPRLMRWDFDKISTQGLEKSFSTTIDALGLKIFRSRRVVEQFTREEWVLIKNILKGNELKVFGVSGAFPLYRKSAIDHVAFSDGTMFDETYHVYKEDVDLAYRLASAGFSAYVILDTVAYHDRSGAGPKDLHDWAAVENRQKLSQWVKYHSYKNHLRTIYKNISKRNLILDFPWIFWYEFKKFIFLAIYDRGVLVGLKEIWDNRSDLHRKRREIFAKRKVAWHSVRRWMR